MAGGLKAGGLKAGGLKAGWRSSEFWAAIAISLITLVAATVLCWFGRLEGTQWALVAGGVPGGLVAIYTAGRSAAKVLARPELAGPAGPEAE